jgi:hypothetical protein
MAHEICEGLVAKGIEVYLAGERESLRHAMEAASYWHRYLTACMAHAPGKGARARRAQAVARLERELASRTGRAVRVNELLRAWGAWAALAEGQQLVAPLCAFRDTWGLLIERRNRDTCEEHWALLEEAEEECRALFLRCVEGRVPTREARGLVRQLVVEHSWRQAAARRAEVDRLARELKQAEAAGAQGQQALQKALAAAEKQARDQECRARNLQAKLGHAGTGGDGKPQAGEGEDPAQVAAQALEFIAQAADPAAALLGLLEGAGGPGLRRRVQTPAGRRLLTLLALIPDASPRQLDGAIVVLGRRPAAAGGGAAA